MKNTRLLLITILLLLNVSYADTASDLGSLIDNMSSLEGSFTYQIHSNLDVNDNDVNFNGKIIIKKPSMFMWEPSDISEPIIISNGEKIFIQDRELEQIIIKSFHQYISNSFFDVLFSKVSSLKKVYTIEKSEVQKHEVFKLIPINKKDSDFEMINLSFADNLLKSIIIVNYLGQKIEINLYDLKINESIQIDIFNPKLDDQNIEIIDETEGL